MKILALTRYQQLL